MKGVGPGGTIGWRAYGTIEVRKGLELAEGSVIPNDPELPLPLNKVHPIHEVVHVDYFLPGCPPPADRIKALLTQLLHGLTPHLEGPPLTFG